MVESPDCGDSFGNKLRGSIREILPQTRYRTASRPASWGIVPIREHISESSESSYPIRIRVSVRFRALTPSF